MTAVLPTYRKETTTGWEDAWVGMEPTFSTAKAVRKWAEMSATKEGEDAYFEDEWMLRTEKRIGRAIEEKYARWKRKGRAGCPFDGVERETDEDPWGTRRQNLHFRWAKRGLEDFEVKVGIDPEIFEFSIKPVPVAWLYEDEFVRFLQAFVWDVPRKQGLVPTIAHGGGQFSLSAKTFLTGSLLADDVAARLNHPELSTWVMDWPNGDDRCFRATSPRLRAFRRVIDEYWRGEFHPDATGPTTLRDAYLDRPFERIEAPRRESMDPQRGPRGGRAAVFQTNFAFARALRWRAQNVEPGYWQSAHAAEEGYRPDQVMRYGEANANRIQVKGEWHVKRGDVLDADEVPEADTPLDFPLLGHEASWEDRGQTSRTSASDFVEAILLDVHAARWLQAHPHPRIAASLHQDRLLGDAEETLARKGKRSVLDGLRRAARKSNLEASRGRLRSDWIEPETLFWAAWRALSPGERSEVAEEAVSGFAERVAQAASVDPRRGTLDPMEAHRHRVHPHLWAALSDRRARRKVGRVARDELAAWSARRDEYLARRPAWSFGDAKPPWEVVSGR